MRSSDASSIPPPFSVASGRGRRGRTAATAVGDRGGGGATLFGLPGLLVPTDFVRLANEAMRECDSIRMTLATSLSSSSSTYTSTDGRDDDDGNDDHRRLAADRKARSTLRRIDDISNVVCTVIDAAELCRSVHASPRWRRSASDAFGMLSEYIGSLNADASIYLSLRRFVFADDDRGSASSTAASAAAAAAAPLHRLPPEHRRMALAMRREFERDGIHLAYDEREDARELGNVIVGLESLFAANITERIKYFDVTGREMVAHVDGVVPRHVLGQLVRRSTPPPPAVVEGDRITLSSDALLCNTLLAHSPSPELRREVHMQSQTSVPENLDVLDALVRHRHQHSVMLGYESYAHRVLSDRMVGTPENAIDFLNAMEKRGKDVFRGDMEAMLHSKRRVEGGYGKVEAWDVPYYTNLIKAQRQYRRWGEEEKDDADDVGDDPDDDASQFAGYFTVENSIGGMKLLVKELFGIDMREVEMPVEERWDVVDDADAGGAAPSSIGGGGGGGLRKFVFHHEADDGELGTMFFDLHPRDGKFLHAAHFTIRCGRMRNDEDGGVGGCRDGGGGGARGGGDDDHQLPIVALVCNLSPSQSHAPGGPSQTLLSHSEVETLYHEFGHGLHSLLSRTSFQHLSGTRASLDFVETPSHLFESFARDPSFLSRTLARHYLTGRPMSERRARHLALSHLDFRGVEVQTQIVHSRFDQALFGPELGGRTSTTGMFEMLHEEAGVPFAGGTHWHSRFGHLVTYGAGYYGYLYAQTFAADIWTSTLASSSTSSSDAVRREGGTKIWKEMLIHGGAKDPMEMIRAVLGREPSVDPFFKGMNGNSE